MGVVVVLDSVEQRRRDFHQRVVRHLLLLAAGVAVVQVVHFVCYLCEGKETQEAQSQPLM